MNKYSRAISANLIFFILNTITFLVLTPIAIHIMGEEFYGLWSVLYSIMLFSNIGTMGISAIVNKFSAEVSGENKEKRDGEILTSASLIISVMGIVIALTLLLLSGWIARNMHVTLEVQNQYSLAIRICAVGILPQFLAKIPQGYLLSLYKNQPVRSLDYAANIFPWIGSVIISIVQKNISWIAIWFTIIQWLILAIYVILMRRIAWWELKPRLAIVQRMMTFSVYLFIESVAISMFQQLDKIIVGFVLGPAMAGVYAVGTSLGLRMSMVAGQVTEVMIPYASLKDSVGESDKLFAVVRVMSKYISLIMAVIASLLIIWMKEILTWWISADFAARYSIVFRILIMAYGLLSISRSGHQTLVGMGRVRFTSVTYFISSLLMLIGVYVFSYAYGLVGAAIANSLMTILLLFNIYTYKLLSRQSNFKKIIHDYGWGILVPILVLFLVSKSPTVLPFRNIILTLVILTFGCVYILNDDLIKNRLLFLWANIAALGKNK